MAVKSEKLCTIELSNGPDLSCISIPAHPKSDLMGKRPLFISKSILIDYDDAKDIK